MQSLKLAASTILLPPLNSTFSFQTSFLGWNIGTARREEDYPLTKWDVRSPHVRRLIKEVNADIVALVELRDLKTSRESANMFLGQFPEYDVVKRRYCHFAEAFQMALLFKPEKFFVGNVRVHNFENDPQHDKIVMFVDLQEKGSKKWFTVGVTHFDLPEEKKWRSVHILRPLITQQRYPCLVYGDYNFFSDRDGDAQRAFMLHSSDGLRDLAWPLYFGQQNPKVIPSEPLHGTFIGFPHDEFKKSLVKASRLDHVFATHEFQVTDLPCTPNANSYMFDNEKYETYTYPSDHLAIKLELALI